MARENSRGNPGREKRPDFPVIKIITPSLRLSYPKLFDPVENDQGQEVWEVDALIPPTKVGDRFKKELEDALYSVMEEYFGPEDEWPRGKTDGHPDEKIRPVKVDKLPGPGVTPDWSVFRARSYQAPGICDADKNEVLNKREVYGGRWARLSLTVTVYDNKSKGPAIYLNNVQLTDHDTSFGGRSSAESDFDRYDGDDDDDRGGRRGRDRDDDRDSRSRSADRGGRGSGRGSSDDGRREDRSRARSDRDEGRSDRDGAGDRGRARRDDDGASRGRGRDDDRSRDDRVSDRDGGRSRDRGEERAGGDGRRRSDPEDTRGGGRSRREEPEDRDTRDRRGSRDDADDRADRGRGRGRDDEEDGDDPRPSRRGGGGRASDDDWN